MSDTSCCMYVCRELKQNFKKLGREKKEMLADVRRCQVAMYLAKAWWAQHMKSLPIEHSEGYYWTKQHILPLLSYS